MGVVLAQNTRLQYVLQNNTVLGCTCVSRSMPFKDYTRRSTKSRMSLVRASGLCAQAASATPYKAPLSSSDGSTCRVKVVGLADALRPKP